MHRDGRRLHALLRRTQRRQRGKHALYHSAVGNRCRSRRAPCPQLPEYAREGDDYRELRDNLQEYARQQEEDEASQPHRGRGAPRTHYRAVLSFEERVETEEARDMADEWIEREFPDSRAVAAVHQDSDHTHVHVHLQARDIDGYKLQLDDDKYRELDSEWAEIRPRIRTRKGRGARGQEGGNPRMESGIRPGNERGPRPAGGA